MTTQLSRRGVLAGLGAATGAIAVGALASDAGAEPVEPGPFVPGGGFGTKGGELSAEAVPPLIPGLGYRVIDPSAFFSVDTSGAIGRSLSGAGGVTGVPAGTILVAALDFPVGAVLKEVTVFYFATAANATFTLFRKVLDGAYTMVAPVPLPLGAAVQTATAAVSEPVDGLSSYMGIVPLAAGQFLVGLRIGYLPPPQAFVPISPVNRVLDTRTTGGKLGPNEERIVPLGVPGFAKAAVVNLTVTETEQAGFVAVFPANVAWPGNSSINWSSTGQNLANGVITAVDTTGNVKIRGGVAPTHVVMDVQGYLL